MIDNPVFNAIFSHRSVRTFDTEYEIPENQIEQIVQAGQQASTSCTGQMYSVISIPRSQRSVIAPLCGDQDFVTEASFFGIICVDLHRLQEIVIQAGGENQNWPMAGLMIGIFDAGLMSQNMVLAAQSLGYDICFCGSCGDKPEEIIDALELPPMVMPLTGLAIGKATEDPPIRPRLPTNIILHHEKYRQYTPEELNAGIEHMSEKLVAEGYYEKYSGRKNYGWRDHMKNKFGGKWLNIIEKRRWKALQKQKFVDLSDLSLEKENR